MTITKDEAAAICKLAHKGVDVTLKDGRTGVVVDVDEHRECLWLLPDGEPHDVRAWASQVERFHTEIR